MSSWSLQCGKTRNRAAASSARRVLVLLYAWILHPAAPGHVGRGHHSNAETKCFLPDIPSPLGTAQRQADHSVSRRHAAERCPCAFWRVVHHDHLRWSRSRSRLSQDAEIARTPSAADNTEDHENHSYTCA